MFINGNLRYKIVYIKCDYINLKLLIAFSFKLIFLPVFIILYLKRKNLYKINLYIKEKTYNVCNQ